jgi:hypothetical protein
MTATIVLTFCFIWFVASVFYQSIIRRFGTDSTRFGLFALRDEMRLKAITEEMNKDSFAFQYLEHMLNCMVHFCGEYSVSHVIESRFRRDEAQHYPEYERYAKEATPDLRAIEEKALNKMFFAMVVNSPGWLLVSGIAFLAMTVFRGQYEFWFPQQNRIVWRKREAMA